MTRRAMGSNWGREESRTGSNGDLSIEDDAFLERAFEEQETPDGETIELDVNGFEELEREMEQLDWKFERELRRFNLAADDGRESRARSRRAH